MVPYNPTIAADRAAQLTSADQLHLTSEQARIHWAATAAARERAWVDSWRAALEAEVAHWHAAAAELLGAGRDKEAAEAVACLRTCKAAAERLTAASMALNAARSSLVDSGKRCS